MEEPLVDPERGVEPHDVIEARDLDDAGQEGRAVREERGREEGVVRGVGEEVAMERRIVGEAAGRPEPPVSPPNGA